MEFLSWTIAVILGVSAIISPIVTAKINNKHQLSLKKLDMYEDVKRKTLIEFIECAEIYLLDGTDVKQYINYYSSLDKLFIYFSNVNLDMFINFEKYCKTRQHAEATVALTNIVVNLSKQITKE